MFPGLLPATLNRARGRNDEPEVEGLNQLSTTAGTNRILHDDACGPTQRMS
jgi:hypothetical protein